MKPKPSQSAARLIAIGFFVAAALVGLGTALYFREPRDGAAARLFTLGSSSSAGSSSASASAASLAAGSEGGLPLGAHLARALGAGSAVWGAHPPTRLVRRSFTDADSGLEVVEESAYFEVPEAEGEALAEAVRTEQAASGSAEGRLDEVLLLRRRQVGAAAGAAAGAEEGEEAAPAAGAGAGAAVAAAAPGAPRRRPSTRGAQGLDAPVVLAAAALPPPPPPQEWAPLVNPTRPSEWVEAQRVVAGEREGMPASTALAGSTIVSLNPPAPPPSLDAAEAAELAHRLVVAVSMGVHSGGLKVATPGDRAALALTPLIKVMLATFLPTAQPHHAYRFYFAFDHNDPVYEVAANRDALSAMYAEGFAGEDALRWHPGGSNSSRLDGSRLHASVHWVHCDYSGKPGWAHSDASVAAVREGADYVYRSNDDSKFPELGDWVDRWIKELRGRSPVPNIGVTGPTCNEGATWILTHDFTHRSHVSIFGFQYPRSLPDWSSDDWVTYVYSAFGLQSKIAETVVGHTFVLGTRYEPTNRAARLEALNSELQRGARTLDEWLRLHKGVTLPYSVKQVDCC